MYGQAVSGVGGIAVDAAQSDAHGRVFVVVFFAVGRVHNDVTTLRCVHMVFLVLIPDVTVLCWSCAPTLFRKIISERRQRRTGVGVLVRVFICVLVGILRSDL